MYTRRKLVAATAGASVVALAGCSGGSDDDNDSNDNGTDPGNLEIGESQFDAAALRDNGTTVTVPVTNPGPTNDVEVTLSVLDDGGSEIDSYTATNEIERDGTVDFEFEVEAAPNASSLETSAGVAADGNSSE